MHVLSRSLTELPAGTPPTVHLTKSSPEDLLDELGSRSVKRVYIDGGITIQNFLARDLIDELTIARVPVLLGNGRTFFGAVPEDLLFQHVSTDVFATGTVQSKYIRKRQ